MFESGFQWKLTDYAMNRTGKLHGKTKSSLTTPETKNTNSNLIEHEPSMWDNLKGHVTNHLDSVNQTLKDAGLPSMNSPRYSPKV